MVELYGVIEEGSSKPAYACAEQCVVLNRRMRVPGNVLRLCSVCSVGRMRAYRFGVVAQFSRLLRVAAFRLWRFVRVPRFPSGIGYNPGLRLGLSPLLPH